MKVTMELGPSLAAGETADSAGAAQWEVGRAPA